MKHTFRVAMCAAPAGLIALVVAWSDPAAQRAAAQGSRATRSTEEFDTMIRANSNWGRWGKDDQRGASNLITDAKRKHAASLVKTGTTVSLAHNPLTEKSGDNP